MFSATFTSNEQAIIKAVFKCGQPGQWIKFRTLLETIDNKDYPPYLDYIPCKNEKDGYGKLTQLVKEHCKNSSVLIFPEDYNQEFVSAVKLGLPKNDPDCIYREIMDIKALIQA